MKKSYRRLAASCLAVYGIAVPIAVRAQQVVGVVSAANASPTGRAPGQAVRPLRLGADIFFKDHIATKRGGAAQLTFLDRSTLNVSENSDIVIDDFVYNPSAGGKMTATLTRGTLKFVGGDISHDGGTTIKTPVVTIGIRGGIGLIAFVKDAAALSSVPGVPADFRGGTIVVNGYGSLSVRNGASEIVISRPGFAVFVGSANEAIGPPRRFDTSAAQALMKSLASKVGQRGGASSKVATLATREAGQIVHIPVVIPRSPTIDGLSFTGVFSSGTALARNQAHVHQAAQLQQQIASGSTPGGAIPGATTSSGSTSGGSTSGGSKSGGSTSGGSASGGSTSGGSTSGGSTSGGSTSGGSTSGGVESVHDLNASTVTANVIYAHTIDAATIQGVVRIGNGYGNGSGSDVNESTFSTGGQLNAHDIHASTVIANFIYVDSINN